MDVVYTHICVSKTHECMECLRAGYGKYQVGRLNNDLKSNLPTIQLSHLNIYLYIN